MKVYDCLTSADFDAVTAAIRYYVEMELFPQCGNVCSTSYQYAIKTTGFADIYRDYVLKVGSNGSGDDGNRAFQMVDTLTMPRYPHAYTGMTPDDLRLFLKRLIDGKVDGWEKLEPIYKHIYDTEHSVSAGWGDIKLPEEHWETLKESGITVQTGGIRIKCCASRVKRYGREILSTEQPSGEYLMREGHLAVGFDGCVKGDYNCFFSFKILKRFLQILKEYQPDTLYTYNVKSSVDCCSRKDLDFWHDIVFKSDQ